MLLSEVQIFHAILLNPVLLVWEYFGKVGLGVQEYPDRLQFLTYLVRPLMVSTSVQSLSSLI